MSTIIHTESLRKTYKVHRKEPGLRGSIRSLFTRRYEEIAAVQGVSFTITQGELVGFIGPNGAGKTTTLKMLTGLLHPTSGQATVLGHTPWHRSKHLLKQLSLIMGQKNQLGWDLPLYDSLLLQRDIYEMNNTDFQASLQELTELLDLQEFLKIQVRKLSLGQRMRGELAAAFLYRPKVLFLDEPTIGLDVVAQRKIREFIAAYNQRHQATIILTSHYLDDVRELCRRLIIIDHGEIKFDGSTDDLIARHVDHKLMTLVLSHPVPAATLAEYGRVIKNEFPTAAIQVPRDKTSARAAALLTKLPIEDISITEPSLEEVVRELFAGQDYA